MSTAPVSVTPQSTDLQGAAPQLLGGGVWIPSLLKRILPRSWVFNHSGEHEFTLPGNEFVVQNQKKKTQKPKPYTSQPRKDSVRLSFDWAEMRGSSEEELWIAPWRKFSVNYRGVLGSLTWEAEVKRVVRICSASDIKPCLG